MSGPRKNPPPDAKTSSGPSNRQPVDLALPRFDPAPSADIVVKVSGELGIDLILIGRLAVFSYLADRRQPTYTKDVDVAVRRGSIPALAEWSRAIDLQTRTLQIGGIMAESADGTIRIDFIDRSSEEYGDLSRLIDAAIDAARRDQTKVHIGPHQMLLCPLQALIALKFIAGRDKDLDDVRALLELPAADVDAVRKLLREHTNGFVLSNFENFLQRIAHPKARNYDDSES